MDLISLGQKVAVVTGAASGIGRATAKRLSEVGASVALVDIDHVRGSAVAEEIGEGGGITKFYVCDVTSDSECKRTVEAIYRDFGRIDILVNCAGVIVRKSAAELSEEEWDFVVGVNLKGTFLVSHHVIPHMIKGGGGSIVNIGSGWGLKGGPKAAAYCASKGGVVNLTRAMAIDQGRQGIRVNCVCPGDVDTPMLRREAEQLGVDMDEFLREAADRPINRLGRPEDVANAVLYLASDLSSWVTGAILVVDGGGLA